MRWTHINPQHSINPEAGLEVYSIDREWLGLKDDQDIFEVTCDWASDHFVLTRSSVRSAKSRLPASAEKISELAMKMAAGLDQVLGKYEWR